jgi:hypothetical protein
MYYLSVLRDMYDEKLLCLITTSYPTSFKLDPEVHQHSSHSVLTLEIDSHNVGIKATSWPLQYPLLCFCCILHQQVIRSFGRSYEALDTV